MSSSQQPSHPGTSRRSIPNSDRVSESMARSDTSPAATPASQTQRNDESWVEVASQPSSSSLSSIGDEIVTTGLRVGSHSHPPRRRRLQHHYYQSMQQQMQSRAAAQAGTSSQDEYDETESEEDRLMTSSNENMGARPGNGHVALQRSQTAIGPGADLSDSEDDDNGTALGRPSPSQGFRPQPNAFSHPPAHLSHRSYSTSSAVPPHHPAARTQSYSHRSHHRARAGFMSPAYQADNDAALRASLTTLLSCAAAAKSLPGRRNVAAEPSSGEPVMGAGVGPSSQPMELRLVPESELGPGGSPVHVSSAAKPSPRTRQPTTRTTSNSSAQSAPASVSSKEEKGKRAASTAQQKPQRATKKKKVSAVGVDDNTVTWISPATLTWVLGTGVVLLVSVVGFGAGFVVGREVGRQDVLHTVGGGGAPMGAGTNATSCGGEVIRSTGSGTLRRWRWGSGMGRLVSA
ncbi:hypothetical protein N8I77_004575 [Diaporthe amygdali]|uniref:Uncharacterized protein n=1 Tax=Phomopsis amygdali TaxID=1214568 RepID=A0AAD9SMC4_PHOAM|nr:hypothetical protein N8I77_004575 [Diaporthe amygdali]